eukprot:m.477051 g.477051  ORF g.477051 m.477051 type:complete len:155 (+) comp20740_c0_seq1:71-535(+)
MSLFASVVRQSARAARSVRTLRAAPVSARALTTSVLRAASDPIPGDSKSTELGVTGKIPDVHEQATGIERKELNELLKGNDDPFGLAGAKEGEWGTWENPRMVPSHFDNRLVGCLCTDPDSETIAYFDVKLGEPNTCPCGQVFALEKVEAEVTH